MSAARKRSSGSTRSPGPRRRDAALRIIKGIEKNQPRILIGGDARFMDLLQRFRPGTYWNVMARRIAKAAKAGKKEASRRSTSHVVPANAGTRSHRHRRGTCGSACEAQPRVLMQRNRASALGSLRSQGRHATWRVRIRESSDSNFKQQHPCRYNFAFSRRDAPELCLHFAPNIRGRRECRAPDAPAAARVV